jgi:transposase-like protein
MTPSTNAADDRRELVHATLKKNGGNVKRTARETGVSTTTVRRWRNELNIPALASGRPPQQSPIRITDAARNEVLRLYADGYGCKTIAAKMTQRGFLTPTRSRTWYKRLVRRILEAAEVYDGHRTNDSRQSLRFWDNVVTDQTGCWRWAGTLNKKGYGRFADQVAHRYAYEEATGLSLGTRQLHHSCHTRNCVRPSHLTPAVDNAAHAQLERLEREFVDYVTSEAGQAELAALPRSGTSVT